MAYRSPGEASGTITGLGTLNGVSGYTFVAKLEGDSKNGAGFDKFQIRIYGANNALVYDSSTKATNPDGTLTGGKLTINYGRDDFARTMLEGAGTFLSGAYNFDIDVQSDAAGSYDSGAGVRFTQGADPNYTYTLTSETITNVKIGNNVTVTGTCMINGIPATRSSLTGTRARRPCASARSTPPANRFSTAGPTR